MRASIAALLLVTCAASNAAVAQEMPDSVTDRCMRAAVKIVATSDDGGSSSGSGSVIDPRGYVLTNFHVVGRTRPDGGLPGQLYSSANRITLGLVENARDNARPRWVGRVVRADARLDLALVRIVSDLEGHPLPARTTFPSVETGGTRDLRPGARLFAFGFPLGVRTINVSGGHLTGFQMNVRDDVSWLRTDAEFNPGNSGGMLVDQHGRLVAVPTSVMSGGETLEPIELARPAERIPPEWLASLARGHIDDVRIEGVPTLDARTPLRGSALGDGEAIDLPERHFVLLPRERPGTVRIVPPLPLTVIDASGDFVRRGAGAVQLGPETRGAVLEIDFPEDSETAIEYELRYELTPREPPAAARTGAPGTTPPGLTAIAPPAATARPSATSPVAPSSGDSMSVRGSIIDAFSGRPVDGMILVGRPGLDLQAHIAQYLAGRLGEAQFRAGLAGFARVDAGGHYVVSNLPRGFRYPIAGLAQGYAPTVLSVQLQLGDATTLDLGPLRLAP